eukprot:766705-Hanusia_phi.AAC.4
MCVRTYYHRPSSILHPPAPPPAPAPPPPPSIHVITHTISNTSPSSPLHFISHITADRTRQKHATSRTFRLLRRRRPVKFSPSKSIPSLPIRSTSSSSLPRSSQDEQKRKVR